MLNRTDFAFVLAIAALCLPVITVLAMAALYLACVALSGS